MRETRQRGRPAPAGRTPAESEATSNLLSTPLDQLSGLSRSGFGVHDLALDTVLQGGPGSARSLTGARYGAITLMDDAGTVEDHLCSGLDGEEAAPLREGLGSERILEYLAAAPTSVRVPDLPDHLRAMGLPELSLPAPAGPGLAFLAVPVLHGDRRAGHLHVAGKNGGPEFTGKDQETLNTFSAPAATVIAGPAYRSASTGATAPAVPPTSSTGAASATACRPGIHRNQQAALLPGAAFDPHPDRSGPADRGGPPPGDGD